MSFLVKSRPFWALLFLIFAPHVFAQARTAQDMVKECKVALDIFQGRVERNLDNSFLAAQCVGYLQGVSDVSTSMADRIKGLKICMPDHVSTTDLIEKFISFVESNPKYEVASTAFQMMLSQEYPCKK
jgi:Rap1a immunity proteins